MRLHRSQQVLADSHLPEDSKLLKINAASLKRVMDDDLAVGYPVQRMISRTYFNRYLDTMSKLQTVAESLALRAE